MVDDAVCPGHVYEASRRLYGAVAGIGVPDMKPNDYVVLAKHKDGELTAHEPDGGSLHAAKKLIKRKGVDVVYIVKVMSVVRSKWAVDS